MATPPGGDPPAVLDNKIVEAKAAIQEIENVDHFWPLTGTQVSDTNRGKHRRVIFREVLASDPTLLTGEAGFYTKTVSGVSELFFKDNLGSVKQITTGGKLNLTAAEINALAVMLTGDQTLAGIKTFGSIPVLPAVTPTTANQAARKQYVDDSVAGLAAKGLFYSGATVFQAAVTAVNTFQDLSLAAIVGAARALVHLEVTTNGQTTVVVKPRGMGSTFGNHMNLSGTANGSGCAAADFLTAGKFMYLDTVTDASGYIQIGANYGGVILTVKLVVYNK
jgi:hypothetical protein